MSSNTSPGSPTSTAPTPTSTAPNPTSTAPNPTSTVPNPTAAATTPAADPFPTPPHQIAKTLTKVIKEFESALQLCKQDPSDWDVDTIWSHLVHFNASIMRHFLQEHQKKFNQYRDTVLSQKKCQSILRENFQHAFDDAKRDEEEKVFFLHIIFNNFDHQVSILRKILTNSSSISIQSMLDWKNKHWFVYLLQWLTMREYTAGDKDDIISKLIESRTKRDQQEAAEKRIENIVDAAIALVDLQGLKPQEIAEKSDAIVEKLSLMKIHQTKEPEPLKKSPPVKSGDTGWKHPKSQHELDVERNSRMKSKDRRPIHIFIE